MQQKYVLYITETYDNRSQGSIVSILSSGLE